MIKILNEKINNLYQSQKKYMGERGLLWGAFILLIISCLFFILYFFSDKVIDKIIIRYLIIAFIFLTILFFTSYFYIYSKKKISKRFAGLIIVLYKIFLILCFVVCIPIIIFMKTIEIILSYRAKKLDNLKNWLIIIIIDLFVIKFLCYIDILSAKRITDLIICFAKQHNCNIIKYPLELFLILCFFKIEMDITNTLILKVMNRFGSLKIKKKVEERQKKDTNDYLIKDNIAKYINEKNNDIKEYEENQKDTLRYDLEYQRKTIWKFQLVCLIVLFFIATFIPDLLFVGHQGDAINVITIFTLIMLYIDKRKEWRY